MITGPAAAGESKSVSKYAFGPFVLDPISRRLWRDGEAVAITARVFDILVVLIRRQGQPVDKDVLIEQVWGDLAVEEGNLARNVSTLRKLLGEAPTITASSSPSRAAGISSWRKWRNFRSRTRYFLSRTRYFL